MTVAVMKVAAKRLTDVEVEKFTIIVISVIGRSEENVSCTNIGVYTEVSAVLKTLVSAAD